MSVGVEYTAAGLSGLSLPDAPCERTDIWARAENLTKGAPEVHQDENTLLISARIDSAAPAPWQAHLALAR